jgi:hypothetical protein
MSSARIGGVSRGDQDRQADVFALIETEKEVVVYRGGWGFSLPDQHKVKVNESDRLVRLEMPQARGTYPLDRIEDTGDELRLYLGAGGPLQAFESERIGPGYGFPTIDDELVRLRARYERAGGAGRADVMHSGRVARQQFEAWAQGDDWDAKTTRMRAAVRELEPPRR